MKNIIIASAALLAISAGPALAVTDTSASGTSSTGAQMPLNFTTLDTDRNGSLSQSELNAGGSFGTDVFGNIDTDSSGTISTSELNTWNTNNSGSSSTGMSGGGTMDSGSGSMDSGSSSSSIGSGTGSPMDSSQGSMGSGSTGSTSGSSGSGGSN